MLADVARQALSRLLTGELADWHGLPPVQQADLVEAIGPPISATVVEVGALPADRLAFDVPGTSRRLIAFARHGQVPMVEVEPPPDVAVLARLPAPSVILPQEIRVAGAYAHEYLYKERGLLLTIAERLDKGAPDTLVRCRGIRPLSPSEQLSSDLYLPLDARVVW